MAVVCPAVTDRVPSIQLERLRSRSNTRTRGQEDAWMRGRNDVRTQGHGDARTRVREDARMQGHQDTRKRGRENARTRGRKDVRTQGRMDARTRGRKDARMRGLHILFRGRNLSPGACNILPNANPPRFYQLLPPLLYLGNPSFLSCVQVNYDKKKEREKKPTRMVCSSITTSQKN